jgi:hypothetical protein
MKLTSHERIMRVFQNKPYDRPVLKLWGAVPGQSLLHPDYKPVVERAAMVTDIFSGAGSPFNIYAGQNAHEHFITEICPTDDPLWVNRITTCHTPEGSMRSIDRESTIGDPGYTIEHMIKEPADIKKLLSLPYTPYPVDLKRYKDECDRINDRGIVMFGLDNPIYALGRLTGSENLALFSYDCRELVSEVVNTFSDRIHNHVKAVLSQGISPVFSWVGPEICIPPLMAVRDFEEFVFEAEKPYCDTIHNAGGYTWLHCHGKVANLIERYIEMGIDVLNPLEPPKNGDVIMSDIVERFGNRIGFEGNIEIQDIIQADTETLKLKMRECVEAGAGSGRFILCPSAGFMEYAHPEPRYIENLLTYLDYGLELVEQQRK